MTNWTVMLKTEEGTQPVSVEAEVASKTDDGRELEFYNFGSLKETFDSFEALSKDLPREESIENFGRLLRAISKFRVASFKSEAVIGYYHGDAAPGR
jgi:hypothetical protein